MANFKTFTDSNKHLRSKKIAVDMDRISCYYEDVLKAMKVNIHLVKRQCMDSTRKF